MIKIDFPPPFFKTKTKENKAYIFDGVRKKWVHLTPEEWVRQNIIAYLLNKLEYPISLLAIEKEITLNDLKRRCDIVVYSNSIPWMIIECKEPETPLNEKVLTQILNYNISLQVRYLIITNGKDTWGWKIENNNAETINSFPFFTE